jgi:integrating conjugative element protein (TIGR03761 family)
MGIGKLVDEKPDTMTLHTKEAFRMFRGRQPDADGRGGHIPGGRRFAAVLKSIWYLSGNDNPYADWLLITMHDRLSALRSKIEGASAEQQRLIDRVKAQGLSFSVLKSNKPKLVELGFRSPYGYATASVIVAFDYHVRMVKTLIRKDRMSDAEGAKAIRALGRELVGLFLAPVQWERFLRAQEMSPLCRADFLPTATDDGRKRVMAGVARLGEVPRPILTGAHAPRHTRRWVKLAQSELRAIDQALLGVDNSTDIDESPLL